MDFLHCQSCGETIRRLALGLSDPDVTAFESRHAGCRLERLRPTGAAISDRPWHGFDGVRLVCVEGERGVSLAVGTRPEPTGPLAWQIQHTEVWEEFSFDLDQRAFWAGLERKLYPLHVGSPALQDWAESLGRFVRSLPEDQVEIEEDDPAASDRSRGRVRGAARDRLADTLAALAIDRPTLDRVSASLDDESFPPVIIQRRLVTRTPSPRQE